MSILPRVTNVKTYGRVTLYWKGFLSIAIPLVGLYLFWPIVIMTSVASIVWWVFVLYRLRRIKVSDKELVVDRFFGNKGEELRCFLKDIKAIKFEYVTPERNNSNNYYIMFVYLEDSTARISLNGLMYSERKALMRHLRKHTDVEKTSSRLEVLITFRIAD